MPVEIQRALEFDAIPPDADLIRWAAAARDRAGEGAGDGEICIRIVDEAEGRALNLRWRGKDCATNVLSFPAGNVPGLPSTGEPSPLGDIVLCAPVVAREAGDQRKPVAGHWAHLVVHGVLHLRGFDHIEAGEAEIMERAEREVLAGLGIPDPYRERPDDAA
ncbi:MAG: rRNA maturation RNase YbeY [Wenzhouxiangellaceae bacterium]|nr:rRNA maturation RNase YbeY [Wenzhouxiangellaceae bacterium]